MRLTLTLHAWSDLLYVDIVGLFGFRFIRRVVTRIKATPRAVSPDVIPDVVAAVETACLLYGKKAQCLQRSAVVTRLLRRHGVPATMVIGYTLPPLRAHAWVQVSQDIVSDKQPGIEHFQVLDKW